MSFARRIARARLRRSDRPERLVVRRRGRPALDVSAERAPRRPLIVGLLAGVSASALMVGAAQAAPKNGTVVGGRTLLYAKAGYTNARAKLTSNDGTGQVTLDKTNLDGARVGLGAEYALGPNAFVTPLSEILGEAMWREPISARRRLR